MGADPGEIKKIYFLGIGGIGMSAMARYFLARGIAVSGYDKTMTPLTKELMKEGMDIHFTDDPSMIPVDTDLVIFTPAIPGNMLEFHHLKSSGVPMLKRSEMLGRITEGKFVIAVAGSHGKTTITSMTGHILFQAGYPVTILAGGICKNYNSNFITAGKDEIMVLEADEYDRSFLQLHPDIAVISSMDADHLDIYHSKDEMVRSFSTFASQVKPGGKMITRKGIRVESGPLVVKFTYAVEEASDFTARNIRTSGGLHIFDIKASDFELHDLMLQVPGRHNIENALAATALCLFLGADPGKIEQGLKSFAGVRRRFDIRINRKRCVYIDDYAHHPEEIKAFIQAVRELYPDKKIAGAFQPHLFSRTRDFADGFAKSLDLLDEILLLDIYPAREEAIPGVSSRMILEKMKNPAKKMVSAEVLIRYLELQRPEVFLTMGAGDIDQLVGPIEELLNRIMR